MQRAAAVVNLLSKNLEREAARKATITKTARLVKIAKMPKITTTTTTVKAIKMPRMMARVMTAAKMTRIRATMMMAIAELLVRKKRNVYSPALPSTSASQTDSCWAVL